MKKTLTTEQITEKIMECEKEMESFKDKDLSKFSKKYLDCLELRELSYNMTRYASE